MPLDIIPTLTYEFHLNREVDYFDFIPFLENKYRIRFVITQEHIGIPNVFTQKKSIIYIERPLKDMQELELFVQSQGLTDLYIRSGKNYSSLPKGKIKVDSLLNYGQFLDIKDFEQRIKPLFEHDTIFTNKLTEPASWFFRVITK